MKQILNRFSEAVLLAVNGNRDQIRCVSLALRDLTKLEARPLRLTEIVYEWSAAICANRTEFEDLERLLLICLELGFRHLDPWKSSTFIILTHTEHHWGLVDVVFKSQKCEVIADFLHALTAESYLPEPAGAMAGVCAGHLVGLYNLVPFSPRLRRLVISFLGIVGYNLFEGAGVERLVGLLDYLHVTIEEARLRGGWWLFLMGVIRSSEGTRRLSYWYWELLVELAVSEVWWPDSNDIPSLEITKSLIDAQEWGKLECWIGVAWMFFGLASITEEDLQRSTLLLLRQQPGAAEKLEQWMEKWHQHSSWRHVPESFQRVLTRAHEVVQRQDAL